MITSWGTGKKDYSEIASRIAVPTFKEEEANFYFSYNRAVMGVAGGYFGVLVWAFDTQYYLVNGIEQLLKTDEVTLKKIYVSCSASIPVNVRIHVYRKGRLVEVAEYNGIGTVIIDVPKGWKFTSEDFIIFYINNPDDTTFLEISEWGDPIHYYTISMFGTAKLNKETINILLGAKEIY